MAERTVWSGTSSQWKNLPVFLLCILVIPIPFAIWRWLVVKNRVYTLTTERLVIDHGVLSRTTDSLELYRVKDLRVTQSFWQRLVGLEDLVLFTSDATTPELVIDSVRRSANLPAQFRTHIEKQREAKKVREIDLE
jgi:uncharacterized membrane protein YdbT with pleckstrin-like domain